MQIAVEHDLLLHQMDVKTAYLNAPIDNDIFMEQAEGFEVPSHDDGKKLVYKLNRSLYGLKQSSRNWNEMLHNHLVKNNFVQSKVDHCLYIRHIGNQMIIILIWVGDLIIATSTKILMDNVKRMFKDKFKMKDIGKLSFFLGIFFEQGDGFVKMNPKKYLKKVLERFKMTDCKSRATPSEHKLEQGSDDLADQIMYREIVGSFIYAMVCTRPDICWIITKLSQYLSKPLNKHMIAAIHVLRYLKGTLNF